MGMKEDKMTAADYVLGDLDDLERARFERAMERDEALRAEVDELAVLTRRMGSLSDEAWRHVMPESKKPARRLARPALRSRRKLLAGLTAVAAAAVAMILVLGSGSSTREVRLTALAGAPSGATATATIDSANHAEMVIERLRPTDRGHYYELWLMTSTSRLVPVASFRVNARGDARMSLPLPAPADRYRYLDVSLQRVGGAGGISSISVLRGPTAGA